MLMLKCNFYFITFNFFLLATYSISSILLLFLLRMSFCFFMLVVIILMGLLSYLVVVLKGVEEMGFGVLFSLILGLIVIFVIRNFRLISVIGVCSSVQLSFFALCFHFIHIDILFMGLFIHFHYHLMKFQKIAQFDSIHFKFLCPLPLFFQI